MAEKPTALDWLNRLYPELTGRQADMKLMNDYYDGDHPLPFVTKAHSAKMRDEFRQLLTDSRSNFMQLVVDATEERLKVEGFRLSASQDEQADARSWEIWQANSMDSESQTAFVEALIKGVSYLSVWKAEGDDHPTIAVEDPTQMIVGYEPGSNFRKRAAALKVWNDEWTGRQRANVFLPDGVYKFERDGSDDDNTTSTLDSQGRAVPNGSRRRGATTQTWRYLPDEFVENPLGDVVPIVALRNRPRLLVEGRSEIANVFRIQNQINGFLFLLALAGYFGAHRQRWAAGISLLTDSQGRKREGFDAGVDKLWWDSNPDATFGEFSQTDLTQYSGAIEQKVRHIATTTRTPRHYLEQTGQSPSGDAIKSAESGLVKKVERKQGPFGEGLEEAILLARRFDGETDTPPDSEIIWANPEVRTEAEITDAAIKKFQARLITRTQALADLGYSQTTIARMLAEGESAMAPPPAPPVVPTEPPPGE